MCQVTLGLEGTKIEFEDIDVRRKWIYKTFGIEWQPITTETLVCFGGSEGVVKNLSVKSLDSNPKYYWTIYNSTIKTEIMICSDNFEKTFN